MALQADEFEFEYQRLLPRTLEDLLVGWINRVAGAVLLIISAGLWLSMLTWSATDPSLSYSSSQSPTNLFGAFGASVSDLLLQTVGLSSVVALVCLVVWSLQLVLAESVDRFQVRIFLALVALLSIAGGSSSLPTANSWTFLHGYGGILGDISYNLVAGLLTHLRVSASGLLAGLALFAVGFWAFACAIGLDRERLFQIIRPAKAAKRGTRQRSRALREMVGRVRRRKQPDPVDDDIDEQDFEAPETSREGLMTWLKNTSWRRDDIDYGAPEHDDRGSLPTLDGLEPRNAAMAAGNDGITLPMDSQRRNAGEVSEDLSIAGKFVRRPIARPEDDSRQLPLELEPAEIEADEEDLPLFLGGTRTQAPVKAAASTPQPAAAPPRNRKQAYRRPSLNELSSSEIAKPAADQQQQAQLQERALQLTNVLADFRVKGEVTNVRPGPVVTLFEFEPARGTKSSRVIALADDVARSMSAQSARISVIPGRTVIGIELPNESREKVILRELLETDAYRNCDARLPLALGKGIGGEPVIADLARMPHLLVAGTTGAGKSVAVNAMILSLLYRRTPQECKLLMIDPKMLELSAYNGIPHLLSPVITDPQQAVGALSWAVAEMEERYKLMSELGVRNIDVFNNRVRHAQRSGQPVVKRIHTGYDAVTGEALFDEQELDLKPLPYIVIIVDEFGDLMSVAGKEIEAVVQRLAQMARAAGMHLIMATQRPSVDVVTGTIKANFPTRIGFKVASKIDSRTILNQQGAEQLLGQGDMLLATGSAPMLRAHGPFVSDDEVEAVSSALKSSGPPQYEAGLTAFLSTGCEQRPGEPGKKAGASDRYVEAVDIVLTDRKASTSYLQRRMSIGYNRAADLIERMEREGVISAADHAGKRQILH